MFSYLGSVGISIGLEGVVAACLEVFSVAGACEDAEPLGRGKDWEFLHILWFTPLDTCFYII